MRAPRPVLAWRAAVRAASSDRVCFSDSRLEAIATGAQTEAASLLKV
jgi:hypothetical protein